MTELDWAAPTTPPNPAAPKPKCRRHAWRIDATDVEDTHFYCPSCGVRRDELAARRGRTNRSRGNAIERQVAASLGMKRVGQYGGPTDGQGEMFAAQVKSGTAYPERLHRWLKAVPVAAGQTAILVITDAPGPGHKRRGLVVLDLDDWRDLHGEANDARED